MTEAYLQYPEDDHDPYWDVLGDGWNPGHTMTQDEIDLEERTLNCFRPGWVDYKRWIYWKYVGPPTVMKKLPPKLSNYEKYKLVKEQYHYWEIESYE